MQRSLEQNAELQWETKLSNFGVLFRLFFTTLISSSCFRPAMAALLLFVVLVAAVNAHKNFTVTEEAWFDVEIKDYDGIGEDYRGRFVVAMFGDKCPMTTMNFQSLAKGYKRGSVSLCSYQSKVLP